jgi:hypothetical protein
VVFWLTLALRIGHKRTVSRTIYIAIDIGGTNTRIAGVADLDNPSFVSEPIRRRNSTNYEEDIAFIIEATRKIGGNDIKAVGVGVVGTMNKDRTRSLHSKNNAHWNDKPFVEDINRALSCPVFADNDGVVAALGEAYYGYAKNDFAYVIWGTGIGGAMVVHNEQGIPFVRKLDWGKYFGKWEYACGGKELAITYGKRPEELSDMEWQTILQKFGDQARRFATLAAPQAIIFGGSLSVRHRTELEALSGDLGLACKVTSFGSDSGLYGGLALIKNALI